MDPKSQAQMGNEESRDFSPGLSTTLTWKYCNITRFIRIFGGADAEIARTMPCPSLFLHKHASRSCGRLCPTLRYGGRKSYPGALARPGYAPWSTPPDQGPPRNTAER